MVNHILFNNDKEKNRVVNLLLIANTALAQQVDIILIGGQSNATGQGIVNNLPRKFVVDTSVMIFHSQYLKSGKESLKWIPLCAAAESPDHFGVELSLGTELHRLMPEQTIMLIKHGLSGSNLHTQWNPGNRNTQQQGSEYRNCNYCNDRTS